MLAQQRYAQILERLAKDGTVHTAELVKQLNVSSETIRKDLDHLEKTGHLKRVHGGAIASSDNVTPDPHPAGYITLQARNSQHMEEKAAITRYAATLVQEQQVIALDYGSTSHLMAQALKERFQQLTVVTNSIQNALLLADCPGFTVILTGGVLNKNEYALVDTFTPLLERLHIDTFFMSVSGIDPRIGCTDQGFNEVNVQNWLRNASSRTVVLADSSKFGRASLVRICPIHEIDSIITDRGLPNSLRQEFERIEAKLILV